MADTMGTVATPRAVAKKLCVKKSPSTRAKETLGLAYAPGAEVLDCHTAGVHNLGSKEISTMSDSIVLLSSLRSRSVKTVAGKW